jgi:hypothetical protein
MKENVFMPNGLPLISDHELLMTIVEYTKACMVLEHSVNPASYTTRSQLEAAIAAIGNELRMRGVTSSVLELSAPFMERLSGAYNFSNGKTITFPMAHL